MQFPQGFVEKEHAVLTRPCVFFVQYTYVDSVEQRHYYKCDG